ncbi:MAG: GH92 family glycosyl hydrolase [Knoellia sp.]
MTQLPRALARLTAASAVIGALIVGGGSSPASAKPQPVPDPTTLVNTSIGNNGDGTTFPGATVPFGMVQNSPDTQLKKYASYDYAQNSLLGFSQIHLSGVGCQTTGLVRLMPTTGAVSSSTASSYASTFSHANEKASPGRYAVKLDKYDVDAELSATERTGLHRYTYPSSSAQNNVMVEVGEGNGHSFGSWVKVVGDDTIEGYVKGGNFCWETQSERYDIYFSAKFDKKFTSFGSWAPDALTPTADVRDRTTTRGDRPLGAYASFGEGAGQVGVNVGISYVSADGARANRETETGDGTTTGATTKPASFDTLRDHARDTWRGALNRMSVAGGTDKDQRTYYSALYRSLLHPSVGSDVDGQYRGLDKAVHHSDRPYYQMFSLWDTYRSQNQLVSLLYPKRAADMTASILRIYEQGGWVPRWSLGNGETNVMSGDPVTAWVVTNWSRGILDKETSRGLFDALWKNVNEVPKDQSTIRGRDGNPSYVKNGWIGYRDVPGFQFGDTRQSASATLEYAYSDCLLATMADGLGESAKADTLRDRCDNYAAAWDSQGTSKGFTGFPRARAEDGTWVGSADPADSTGFHEGTAWQYQWLAQQDPQGLFTLMGGADKAEQRLDTFFDFPKVLSDTANVAKDSWVVGAYDYHNNFAFNPNNEPDLHAPWMYAWTGSPWKTSAVLRAARPLFSNDAYGMPGNDDLGTISSWLVFGMAGIFEPQPGSGNWLLSAPMFDSVHITPDSGKAKEHTTTIESPGGTSGTLQYVDTVRVKGQGKPVNLTKSFLTNDQLLGSDSIRIGLSTSPTTWGTGAAAQPVSLAGK